MGALVAYAVGKLIIHGLNKKFTLPGTVTDERMEQANTAYRDQIGIGKTFKFNNAPFDEYVEARKKSMNDLPTIFKDEKLKKALEDSTVKDLLKDALNKQGRAEGPLRPDDAPMKENNLDVHQKEYKTETHLFSELCKKIPPLKVEAVIKTMKDIVDRGVHDIERQQQLEKENLKKLFEPLPHPTEAPPATTDSPLVAKLKEQNVDIAAAKKSMFADLKKTHDEQLNTFKTATSTSVKHLHQAAKNDFAEVSFISSLSADNSKMRDYIQTVATANRDKELVDMQKEIDKKEAQKLSTTIDVARRTQLEAEIIEAKAKLEQVKQRFGPLGIDLLDANDADPNVGHVQLADLEFIHSKTGKTIHQKKTGEFTLEIGAMINPFGSPVGYFMGNKIQHDMNLLAEAVRASGKTSIVMNVNYSNEEVAKQRAEQAYKACVNAGYPPDKIAINIMVKGKKIEWKPEEAFSEEERKAFKSKADEVNKNRDSIMNLKEEPDIASVKDVKAELESLKSVYEAQQAEKQRLAEEAKARGEELDEDEEHEHTSTIANS